MISVNVPSVSLRMETLPETFTQTIYETAYCFSSTFFENFEYSCQRYSSAQQAHEKAEHSAPPQKIIAGSVQLFLCLLQRFGNDRIHVVVPISPKAAAEDDVCLLIRQRPVFCVKFAVACIVERIVRLNPGFPFRTVFSADDSLGKIVSFVIFSELKPLMLDDPGKRRFGIGIVDDRIALLI